MKRICCILLIMIITLNSLYPIISVATDETLVDIQFKDVNLYNAIVEELGSKISSRDDSSLTIKMTQEKIGTVENLQLYNKKIEDISGLSSFTNLETLCLDSNGISDVSSLSGLTSLNSLELNKNLITDISSLSGLTNLKTLYLESNQITEISSLSRLTNLETLYLDSNGISDVSGLSGLTSLKELSLRYNKISDVSSLSGLTNLIKLDLYLNKIQDISSLSGLTSLSVLHLGCNQITDISSLSGLTNLMDLYLYVNKIQDISSLSGLTGLRTLELDSNQITDISSLSGLTRLMNLYLRKNQITNISSLSWLTGLGVLILDGNQISDVSSLSGLTNLDYLGLEYAKITDLSRINGLTNLKSLKSLNLGSNQISDVSSLSELTNLEDLYLDENQISDVSSLSGLTSLKKLDLSCNEISDISTLCGLENTSINLNYQRFTQKVNNREIELPQILIYAQDQESKFYTNEQIIYEKCTYNKDTNKIIIDEDINEAKIIIGSKVISKTYPEKPLYGTVITLKINDTVPPETTVNYSTKELTNKDVTVTITANEEIQEIEGWTISKDKKTLTKIYTKNTGTEGEKITVLDLAGNESNVNVVVTNIDKIAPETKVSYSTTEPTTQNVTATITANKEIQKIEGWKLSEDKKILTKTYTENTATGGEKITVLDLAGNESNVNVVVTNIDKIAPEAKVSYSTTEPTDQNVTVTITANELIQEVKGWTLSEDGKKLTKIYTENTEQAEIIKVKDLAGNESKEIKIEVTNIDKNGIIANVNYSTTNKTNQDVTVTITANKKIQKVEGWELSTDGKKLTKIFKQNDSEDVVLKDEAGNTKEIQVKVSNIDKVTPKATTSYSTKELTNQDVIVTITADKIIQAVESWTLSEDGKTLTKIYNQNGNEEVTILDLVGNSTTVKVSVENIDKAAPEIDISYSTTKTTNKDVTVTITANEEIQKVENWTLSEDRKTLTKVYNTNSEEEITVLDLVGNKAVAKVSIQNIEKEQNANGNNNNTTTEKDNNKGEKDNTTASTIIPKAGKSSIIIAFVAIIVIAIVLKNKNKKYRDII